jgi:hypothetical protein
MVQPAGWRLRDPLHGATLGLPTPYSVPVAQENGWGSALGVALPDRPLAATNPSECVG